MQHLINSLWDSFLWFKYSRVYLQRLLTCNVFACHSSNSFALSRTLRLYDSFHHKFPARGGEKYASFWSFWKAISHHMLRRRIPSPPVPAPAVASVVYRASAVAWKRRPLPIEMETNSTGCSHRAHKGCEIRHTEDNESAPYRIRCRWHCATVAVLRVPKSFPLSAAS